jgi:hypothetical protein
VSASHDAVKVFLAGEGANELGSRAGDPAYQSDKRPGVLCVLLSRIQATGWIVDRARDWKSIRKYRACGAGHDDTRNVLGVALDAKEARCDVLAFSRDLDRDPARREAIEEGIRLVPSAFPAAPDVIGGVAVPALEGWILALLGERATEEMSPKRAQDALAAKGVARKDGAAMTRAAEAADLDRIPHDATSLHEWLARARAVLPPKVALRDGQPPRG